MAITYVSHTVTVVNDAVDGGLQVQFDFTGDSDNNASMIAYARITGTSEWIRPTPLTRVNGSNFNGRIKTHAASYDGVKFEWVDPTSGVLDIIVPLTLDRGTVKIGETIRGTIKYKNNSGSSMDILDSVIAGRPPGGTNEAGPHLDFTPGGGPRTIASGAEYEQTATRVIQATDPVGQWYVFGTYRDAAGIWHDAPPSQNRTFTVESTGVTYYVSPSGLDSNAGTVNSPKKTLAGAYAIANPGDVILVRGGNHFWPSMATTPRAGSSSLPITVRNYPGETPVVDGQNGGFVPVVISQSFHVFEGITFTRCGNAKEHSAIRIDGSDCILRNVNTNNCRDAGVRIGPNANRVSVFGGEHYGNTTGVRSYGKNILLDGITSRDHWRMIDDPGPYAYGAQAFAVSVENYQIPNTGPVEIRNCIGIGNLAPSLEFGYDGAFLELFVTQNVNCHHNISIRNDCFFEAAGPTNGCRFWRNESYEEQIVFTHQANDLWIINNTFYGAGRHFAHIGIGNGGLFGNGSNAGFKFVNNIVYHGGTLTHGGSGAMFQLFRALDPSAEINNNVYCKVGQFAYFNYNSTAHNTFASWQSATGRDSNSVNVASPADLRLVNPAARDVHILDSASPAINRGRVVAGAEYVTQGYSGAFPDSGRWEFA